ncbi:SLIT and NTRK-like protein 6 [Bombina bombina]|uniref:SLIT and NTRK-like protein 6 n=1 Tax=Bombina bombina TaxID=8345 RepID=UPI00235AA10D|nr:SLIT and NTRK-like protein 6 [Bombina bombina]XP_053563822.1 SLIT and NTRK-like protein 6 [Bombina bombina]
MTPFQHAFIILLYLLLISSHGRTDSELLLMGSCTTVCSCDEKDGTLFANCEEKNIRRLFDINLPFFQYLDLNLLNNGLQKLRINEFSNFSNLISLHLGFNNIADIEPGAFNNLAILKKLHINYNSLEILREYTFMGLENLEFLQADNNFITTIEPNTFSKLTKLKVLILNDNAIDSLPANIFRFVPLTHLDLRGNQLQSLSYIGFLEHIGRIIEFQLEDNRWDCNCNILQLKTWIDSMPRHSSISDIVCYSPSSLQGTLLRRLKNEMICSTTPSNDPEDYSGPLALLGTSSINDGRLPTKITFLQKGPTKETVIAFPKSTTLLPGLYCPVPCYCSTPALSGSLIHCQERSIESISDLGPPPQNPKKLILAGNLIHIVYKWDFLEYGTLEMLHLGSNRIETIEEYSFMNLTRLQKFYLNGNHLTTLSPKYFFGLVSVEYLYLEYNGIKEILPGTFSSMQKLKVLYLHNNHIQTLPEHVFSEVPLSKLNLKSNQFVNLPVSGVLEELNLISQIELQDNPWDCTCKIGELKNWIQQYKDVIISEMVCRSPEELTDKDLRSLSLEMLCPELKNSQVFPTRSFFDNNTPPASNVESILKSLSDSIPLSVLILGLFIVLIMVIFCSAGIIVLVVHRRRRSKKKHASEQLRETSPVHIQYSMYGQKTTHHTERPSSSLYEQRITSPVVQVYQNPPFSHINTEQEEESEKIINHSKQLCKELLEKENTIPLTSSNMKFRSNNQPSDFLSFQDASYLYRNLIEKEREIQQLGITEYLRKNMGHVQPEIEVHYPETREQIKLMETLMYSRPRKLVEQTKNEYFELKANLSSEPDYLEVLEQHT